MGKRKVTTADEMLPEPVQAIDVVHELIRPDLHPLIDEAIARVSKIGSVGHMFYVKQHAEEALAILQTLRNSA